jgi:hypothetical protein
VVIHRFAGSGPGVACSIKKFLVRIDHEVPAEFAVHIVLDNASTHKTPAIKRWLLARPRFVLDFIAPCGN